ncbi:hypothetical protein B0H11DRAFT_2297150 [Mycena galericulata]|nr:hypothetical protein B0H11DRAFT_2297150 [Mycena galericulata]
MTSLNGVDVYYWFAVGFGDILRFSKPGFSAWYTPLMGSVMALVVQIFFCYRIYIIRRATLWLCILIALVSLLQAAGGICGGISSYVSENVLHDHDRTIFVYMWLIGDAFADILIAAVMTVLLTKASLLQHHHKQTNDIVKRIVRLVIETNTLSMIVAVLSLILFIGTPNTTYFICPTMVLAKLYSNTLLVTFNNRLFIRKVGKWAVSDSYAPGGASQEASKSLPFSAGLGLDSPTAILTVTYRNNSTESVSTGTIANISEQSHLDTLQTPIQISGQQSV